MSKRRPPTQRNNRGIVTIEFAFMMMFGVIPLLFITFTGVMVFAAKQSLTLAAGEGARAALRYGDTAQRRSNACVAAAHSMQWLLNFSGDSATCSNPSAAPINVSQPFACTSDANVQCIQVTATYDYDNHPFMPGTGPLLGWSMGQAMRSTATVQLDLGSN